MGHGRTLTVQKGIVPPARPQGQTVSGPDKFVQVRVQESLGEAELAARGPVCRLHHPSGWLIECGMWPDSQWLLQLMGERP
jgi:hypothetical protein